MNELKIVFMGTPEFAEECLRAVHGAGIEVAAVVTQPDRPQGRGNQYIPSAVKKFAMERGIRVLQPQNVEEFENVLERIAPDFFTVVAFGQILSKRLLAIPAKAAVNVHASLLPKYRGASPINRAIIEGEKETGVTTMLLDEGMDTGDILLVEKTHITTNDTAGMLHNRLAKVGARLLVETLQIFDDIEPEKQNNDDATYANKLTKEDGKIDWTKPAGEIRDLIRGCDPWPSAYTFHKGEMLKVWKANHVGYPNRCDAMPGTTLSVDGGRIVVATGEEALSIMEIQRAGKKRQDVGDFLRGYKIEDGDRLGKDG